MAKLKDFYLSKLPKSVRKKSFQKKHYSFALKKEDLNMISDFSDEEKKDLITEIDFSGFMDVKLDNIVDIFSEEKKDEIRYFLIEQELSRRSYTDNAEIISTIKLKDDFLKNKLIINYIQYSSFTSSDDYEKWMDSLIDSYTNVDALFEMMDKLVHINFSIFEKIYAKIEKIGNLSLEQIIDRIVQLNNDYWKVKILKKHKVEDVELIKKVINSFKQKNINLKEIKPGPFTYFGQHSRETDYMVSFENLSLDKKIKSYVESIIDSYLKTYSQYSYTEIVNNGLKKIVDLMQLKEDKNYYYHIINEFPIQNRIYALHDMINNLYPDLLSNKSIKDFFYQDNPFFLLDAISMNLTKEQILYLSNRYGECLKKCKVRLNNVQNIDNIDNIDKIDNIIKNEIINSIDTKGTLYDETIKWLIGKERPDIFLDEAVHNEIKEKFYNKKFTLVDFKDNPILLEIFGNTNIACGLVNEYSWMISLFDKEENKRTANIKRRLVITEYLKINDVPLQETFKDFLLENKNDVDEDKIQFIADLLIRLSYSNSFELYSFRKNIAAKLLKAKEPLEALEKIEKVFLKNNLPLFAKMYKCFEILYPNIDDVKKFDFSDDSRISPELKDSSLPNIGFHATESEKRMMIIYNDLLRIAYRSNERSFIKYLIDIEVGDTIYSKLQKNNFDFNKLSKIEYESLKVFVSHLEMLYSNMKIANKEIIDFDKLELKDKIRKLSVIFKPNDKYDLKDRIIRSFCYMAGITTFDELKQLTIEARNEQTRRKDAFIERLNKNDGKFTFEEGDFVRGFGSYEILGSTLSSGNVCKEHLGIFNGTSETDTTPLDVDISLITETKDIYHAIAGGPTGFGFGNLFVIFKHDNETLNITRDKDGNLTGNQYNPKKIEMFGTKIPDTGGYETHWGARTGFAFTDVDCILYKKNLIINDKEPYDENGNVNYDISTDTSSYDDLPTVKFEIARNGYYIPVIDFSGKLIFTEQEYNLLREKMQGLKYYGEYNYNLSENLITPEIEEIVNSLNRVEDDKTSETKEKINSIIRDILKEFKLGMETNITEDITPGFAEFIDTGSTGRNTNIPNAGDFDFFMRLDAKIMNDSNNLNKFKERIMQKIKTYPFEDAFFTDNSDLRFKGVKIDNDTTVDIDISFGIKNNKILYSSDLCLKDRLETIKDIHPEQYKNVIANIILAKQVLKNAGVYKPNRGETPQGGLGGVGIENWILQHGGSFIDAAKSFVDAAEGKNYEEFCKVYKVWDFGLNFFSIRRGNYAYDEFVSRNMSGQGYERMVNVLKEFLLTKGYYSDKSKTR